LDVLEMWLLIHDEFLKFLAVDWRFPVFLFRIRISFVRIIVVSPEFDRIFVFGALILAVLILREEIVLLIAVIRVTSVISWLHRLHDAASINRCHEARAAAFLRFELHAHLRIPKL